jgi:hypothetical protein
VLAVFNYDLVLYSLTFSYNTDGILIFPDRQLAQKAWFWTPPDLHFCSELLFERAIYLCNTSLTFIKS